MQHHHSRQPPEPLTSYSDLPEDIVEKIATHHFDVLSQLIAFSGVCKSWRSAALRLHASRRPFLPGLLVPTESPPSQPNSNNNGGDQAYGFSPLTKLSLTSSPPPPIPSITLPGGDSDYGVLAAHSLASKDGWILRTLPRRSHGVPLHLRLLNPITGASIPLPPLPPASAANLTSISQAVISSSPENDKQEECHVFILFRKNPQLAWCNVSSSSVKGWNLTSKNASIIMWPFDAVYSGRKFYVLDDYAVILFHNLTTTSASSSPTVRAFPFSEAMTATFDKKSCYHLCHVGGQVHVILHREIHVDSFLQAYKLVVVGGGGGDAYYWEEVRSLDGHAVFFGSHQSFSLPAADGSNGVRGNHVYFSSDNVSLRPDWYRCMNCDGDYDLVNQKFERFAFRDSSCHGFWFLPAPWEISKLRSETASEEGSETGARYWTLPKKNIKIDHKFQALVLDDG